MTQKVIKTTLASALAAAGTLTLSYPAGTNPGSFIGGKDHRVVTGSGDVFKAPKYFTLSYGASSITLTWGSSSPTLPVNTTLYIQLDLAGSSPQGTKERADPTPNPVLMSGQSLKVINWGAPLTADADGVAASQSVSAGASFTLNGALLSTIATGKMIFDVPRNVVAAWTTTSVLTITGKDEYGNTMVETSASGTSHTGKKAFKSITSVSSSASITGATVGTGNVLGFPVFMPGYDNVVAEFENGYDTRPSKVVYLPWEIEATELAAGTAENLVSPVAGYIRRARAVVQEAVGTGGDITTEVNGVAVVGLTLTVASSATAGTRYSDTPTTARSSTTVVAVGDRLTLTPGAAFATSGAVNGVLEIETLGAIGTIVPGEIAAAQSGTSNDIRGTYAPSTTPDGTTYYSMVLRLSDPDFLGVDQYAG